MDPQEKLKECSKEIDAVFVEVVDAVNKAMHLGMPAKVVSAIMRRILTDVDRAGNYGCHITIMRLDGTILAGEKYKPAEDKVIEAGQTITHMVLGGEEIFQIVDEPTTELGAHKTVH